MTRKIYVFKKTFFFQDYLIHCWLNLQKWNTQAKRNNGVHGCWKDSHSSYESGTAIVAADGNMSQPRCLLY